MHSCFHQEHVTCATTSDSFSFPTLHQIQWLKWVGKFFHLPLLESKQDRCFLGGHQRRGHMQKSPMLWRSSSHCPKRCQGNWCKGKDWRTDGRKEFSRILFCSGGGNRPRGTGSTLIYLPSKSTWHLKKQIRGKKQENLPSSAYQVESLANHFQDVWQKNVAGYFMFTCHLTLEQLWRVRTALSEPPRYTKYSPCSRS